VHTTNGSVPAIATLLVLAVASCGSPVAGSTEPSDASKALVSTSASLGSAASAAPIACAAPTDFASAPVPSEYPLRTEAPESDAPVSPDVKPPLFSSPQAAVDDVVQRLAFEDIKAARIAGPPAPDAVGPWLYVLATVPEDSGAAVVRPQWETVTILGAAAESAATGKDLGDAIEGFVLELQTPDCQIVSESSVRIGPRASGQIYSATADAADTDFATGVLKKYGVTPVKVETQTGVSQILSVVGSIPNAEAMDGNLTAMFEELKGSPPRFESVYLQLETTKGENLAAFGSSPRVASGIVWFEPGLEDVLGITHG
jgi:hypothetical protein